MNNVPLTRREFLRTAAIGVGALILAPLVDACAAPPTAPTVLGTPNTLGASINTLRTPSTPLTSTEIDKRLNKPEMYAMATLIAADGVDGVTTFVNGFKLKEAMPIGIDGNIEQWVRVKNSGKDFSILYDPAGNRWLKVAMGDGKVSRLERSVQAMKASLQVVDMDPSMVALREITMDGKQLKAMEIPHLGPTLGVLSQDAKTTYYQTAFENALNLLDKGYMFIDPNPNNIIVHTDAKGIVRVVLIDFTNGRIANPVGLKSPPTIFALYNRFLKQTRAVNIKFNADAVLKKFNMSLEKLIEEVHPGPSLKAISIADGTESEVIKVVAAEASQAIPISDAVKVDSVVTSRAARVISLLNSPFVRGVAKVASFIGDAAIIWSVNDAIERALIPSRKQDVDIPFSNTIVSPVSIDKLWQEGMSYKLATDARNQDFLGFQESAQITNAKLDALSDYGFAASSPEASSIVDRDWKEFKAANYAGWRAMKFTGPINDLGNRDSDVEVLSRQEDGIKEVIFKKKTSPDELKRTMQDNTLDKIILFIIRYNKDKGKWEVQPKSGSGEAKAFEKFSNVNVLPSPLGSLGIRPNVPGGILTQHLTGQVRVDEDKGTINIDFAVSTPVP